MKVIYYYFYVTKQSKRLELQELSVTTNMKIHSGGDSLVLGGVLCPQHYFKVPPTYSDLSLCQYLFGEYSAENQS